MVSNGLKYTEYGFVNVYTKVQSDVILIEVEDTGIGMKEADLNDLF